MRSLNLELIASIYNNRLTNTLSIEGAADFGPLANAEELFWSNFRVAFSKNNSISNLVLINISQEIAEKFHTLVLQNPQSKVSRLTLGSLEAAAVEKLLPALQNSQSKVSVLRLESLEAAAVEKLLPALQNPQSKVSKLDLVSLEASAVEKLLPALQNRQSNVYSLDLQRLSAVAVEKLLPALQNSQSKVSHLGFVRLEAAVVEKILPISENIKTLALGFLPTSALEKIYNAIVKMPNKPKIIGNVPQDWYQKFAELNGLRQPHEQKQEPSLSELQQRVSELEQQNEALESELKRSKNGDQRNSGITFFQPEEADDNAMIVALASLASPEAEESNQKRHRPLS